MAGDASDGLPKPRVFVVPLKVNVDAGDADLYSIFALSELTLANPDVVGMFGTGATDSLAVGKISQKYDLAAQGVITAGYDLLPETLALIASGDMTFTTDQQPYLQGFIPTLQIYLYKLSGRAVSPANTDTSLAYVTQDNVETYLSPSRFEGSTDVAPS